MANYMTSEQRQSQVLVEKANNLLKKAGFNSNGSPLRHTSHKQWKFERMGIIRTPMGGQPKH